MRTPSIIPAVVLALFMNGTVAPCYANDFADWGCLFDLNDGSSVMYQFKAANPDTLIEVYHVRTFITTVQRNELKEGRQWHVHVNNIVNMSITNAEHPYHYITTIT